MKPHELITKLWTGLAGTDQTASLAQAQSMSLSDGSFADWLRENGSRRGTFSEITYFTCLKVLSESLGKLPWKVYRTAKTGVKESRKKDLIRVLKQRPNPYMTPTIFWSTMEMNRNHYGNAYAYVQRELVREKYGGVLKVKNLWIMPSNSVKVMVDDAGVFGGTGGIWYHYTDQITGESYLFEREDVIHVTTSHTLNGLVGMSVQEILRETVDGSQAAQKYMNAMYEQGMTAKAVLEYTGTLSEPAKEALRDTMEDFGNGPKNTGRIMPVPLGMKLTPLDIKLTDAQFFELRKYTALQVAGAMGVKPNQINNYEKSSYANSEMQQLSFLTETMLFILKQYEEEVGWVLLGERCIERGEYVKINEKAMLRTDSKTQMEILKTGVEAGITLINEARATMDREAVEGGDVPIVNGTMTPLTVVIDKVGTGTTAAEQGKNEPETPEEETEEGDEDDAEK